MNDCCCAGQMDYGPAPYTADIRRMSIMNRNFRTAVWTGCHLQMTLMCIPVCSEIGIEMHDDTDQMIRVEQGRAIVKMGKCKYQMDFQRIVCCGEVIFVPAGTWHNVINDGRIPLKVSSVYAPPHHPRGTVHCTKADAEKEAY